MVSTVGDRFLGIYYNDEPGGIQLDGNWTEWFAQYGERLNKTEHEPLYNVYVKMKEAGRVALYPQNTMKKQTFSSKISSGKTLDL